jgi:hypothetical protein
MSDMLSVGFDRMEPMESVAEPADREHVQICPCCGSQMRIIRLEPHTTPGRRAFQITYDCSCGERLVETIVDGPGNQSKVASD